MTNSAAAGATYECEGDETVTQSVIWPWGRGDGRSDRGAAERNFG